MQLIAEESDLEQALRQVGDMKPQCQVCGSFEHDYSHHWDVLVLEQINGIN